MTLQEWKRETAKAIVQFNVEFMDEVGVTTHQHSEGLTYRILGIGYGKVVVHHGYDDSDGLPSLGLLSADDLVEIFQAETLEYLLRAAQLTAIEEAPLFAPTNTPTFVR